LAEQMIAFGHFWKNKAIGFSESNNEYTLTVLRHKVSGVDDIMADVVSKLFFENMQNRAESVALIMPEQMFDVFQDEGLGTMPLNDLGHFKKQHPLVFVFKAMFSAQT
jgi:hypothetical protein